MTITHITIPAGFYRLKINEIQRSILALSCAFGEKGLKLTNIGLSELIHKCTPWISEQITDLKSKGFITIKNRQSKYRVIYFQGNMKVNGHLLSGNTESKPVLLSAIAEYTFRDTRNISKRKKEGINIKASKEPFEQARQLYKGTKRGLDTEFKNFQRHKDWKTVLPLLIPAIEKQIRHKEHLTSTGQFCPAWKNFQTWANNRCWEEETPEAELSTREVSPEEADVLFEEAGLCS